MAILILLNVRIQKRVKLATIKIIGVFIFLRKNCKNKKCRKSVVASPPYNPAAIAVSIIRAGDSLLDAVRFCLPSVRVGKILIQRDEESREKKPILYYTKFPKDISKKSILLVDPMLASGGSALCAIKCLLDHGVKEEKIIFINVISCPEGIRNLHFLYPKVKIVTAAIDEKLNENKYIVPGLGDWGDRFYGTDVE